MVMNLNEEINLIKTKMGLFESESESDSDFILNYKKNLNFVLKNSKIIEKFFNETIDDLYKLKTKKTEVCFGSTRTESGESFCDSKLTIIFEFIHLSEPRKREIKSEIFELMMEVFNINLWKYGSPVDVEFINYEPKRF